MKIANSRKLRDTGSVRASHAAGVGGYQSLGGSTGVRAISDDVSIAGMSAVELTPKVRAAIEALMTEVQQLRDDLSKAHKRIGYLEKLADEDTLVPVANRRAFVRELSRMVAYVERYGDPASVLYFDINGLKAINDAHGHAAGDAAIRAVTEVLVANIRGSDFLGRLGGDEFGVILAQSDNAQAHEKAEMLAEAVESRPLVWQQQRLPLSVAHGVHTFTGRVDANEALARADREMYARKTRRAAEHQEPPAPEATPMLGARAKP